MDTSFSGSIIAKSSFAKGMILKHLYLLSTSSSVYVVPLSWHGQLTHWNVLEKRIIFHTDRGYILAEIRLNLFFAVAIHKADMFWGQLLETPIAQSLHCDRCMYVWIEVAICGVPMESGVQLALRGGPSRGPISQPRGYHRSRVTHAGSYMRKAFFVANFTPGN